MTKLRNKIKNISLTTPSSYPFPNSNDSLLPTKSSLISLTYDLRSPQALIRQTVHESPHVSAT